MASGPDHYQSAESFLYDWQHRQCDGDPAEFLAAAQAHATLALAAAMALAPLARPRNEQHDYQAWVAVADTENRKQES